MVPGLKLGVIERDGIGKVFPNHSATYPRTIGYPDQRFPFVDVSFYQVRNGKVVEVVPVSVGRHGRTMSQEILSPFRTYYFAGLSIQAPGRRFSERFDWTRCAAGGWNHRLELPARGGGRGGDMSGEAHATGLRWLDCCKLAEFLPFIHRVSSSVRPDINVELLMVGSSIVHTTVLDAVDGCPVEEYHGPHFEIVVQPRLRPGESRTPQPFTVCSRLDRSRLPSSVARS